MTPFFFILLGIAGLLYGSFLNAFVWRFGRTESIAAKHSQCVHCGHFLRWDDLIPLISYALLRGRCRYCHRRIAFRYPLVEAGTAVVFLLAGERFDVSAAMIAVLAYTGGLLMLFLLDLEYSILPDSVTLPTGVLGIVVAWMLHRSIVDVLLGIALGAGFFALQYAISRGQWIGSGDIRLGGVMGVALGLKLVAVALLLSYVVGALVAVALLLQQRSTLKSHLPFGVFLTLGTFITLLGGDALVTAYLRLVGFNG